MRIAERFRDPIGVLPNYEFHVNHETEEGQERRISVETTAPVSGVGFIRQQGAASPQILKYSGTILRQDQHDAMDAYFSACAGVNGTGAAVAGGSRTVFFRDFTGVEVEVLITAFNPVRKRVAWNQQDSVNAPHHIWTYTLEMQVIG